MKSTNYIKVLIIIILVAILISPAFCDADSRDSDNPYGVLDFLIWDHDWNSYHYNTKEKIEQSACLMKEAGVGFVRMDFLWYDVEPFPDKFDFKKYDVIVNILEKQGIKVLGILHYNPSWDNEPWNKAPNVKFYTRYACAVVEHFKNRVKYWEIWNEPDGADYWVPQDDMVTYTKLLKAVYPAIKKTDPTSKVLMGGVSNEIAISLNRIYRNGGKDYFDIVNIHPFVAPGRMDLLKGMYKGTIKVMQKYGDENKKIWFTEIGCPGVKNPSRRIGWWLGKGQNEEEQAQWVKEVYINCLKWEGVEKVFWAFFRDTDCHFKSAADYFGLIRNDFSKKPSYQVYRKCASKR